MAEAGRTEVLAQVRMVDAEDEAARGPDLYLAGWIGEPLVLFDLAGCGSPAVPEALAMDAWIRHDWTVFPINAT